MSALKEHPAKHSIPEKAHCPAARRLPFCANAALRIGKNGRNYRARRYPRRYGRWPWFSESLGRAMKLMLLNLMLLLGSDDGRYASSPLEPWFESLRNGWGQSYCDLADGIEVADDDWDTRDGHYRVRLASRWTVVPDQTVVQGPSHSHKAVVWLWNEEALKDEWGAIPASPIHCFLPGTGV